MELVVEKLWASSIIPKWNFEFKMVTVSERKSGVGCRKKSQLLHA